MRLWRRHASVFLVVAVLLTFNGTPAFAELPAAADICGPERALMPRSPSVTGSDVVELQERLLTVGYDPGPIDGVYGPSTVSAVMQFQRDETLSADGIVGAETWTALGPYQDPAVPAAAEPRPQGDMAIVIDTNQLTLTLIVDDEPFKTYSVGVGRPTDLTLTPVGEWQIVHKDKDWGDGFGTRWMGLNVPWGIYGIHGTNKPWSIGTRASGGCIRMLNQDVEQLWDWVPIRTPVKIIGVDPDVSFDRTIRLGSSGRDVVFVQLSLQDLGFDAQGADGRFGPNTAAAVTQLQSLYDLPVDGQVYPDVYYILGLK